MRIPLSQPDIGEREIEYVTSVLRSGELSLGSRVAEFERVFAEYIGTRYAIATNSGTSALHLCVRALGIGTGDEVLTTSFSFVASVNCLLYEKAVPVFVDIDPNTLNIDPVAIRETIFRDYAWDQSKSRCTNRRTGGTLKAILPVHVFGQPCEMRAILEIARQFNLAILEDACEALGAEYCGQPVGTFGDASVFAFYPNKQITTAEGGMIVTDSPVIAAECRSMRNQGRDEHSEWLSHVRLGYNYRLSDLHCALGLAQLERVHELLEARSRVAECYSRRLSGVPGLILPLTASLNNRSWFAYVIRVAGAHGRAQRDILIQELRNRGIACQAYFPPIHSQPYFLEICDAARRELVNTVAVAESCVALPLFSRMTEEQIMEVCDAVSDFALGKLAASKPAPLLKHHVAAAGGR
jgi:perosamine synthetase